MVKEERGRRVEGRSGQLGTQEEEEEKGKEERERAHGHRKSGAFHSHAKSSDGGVCSHPGDVATKRTPLPSNHCYRQ